MSYRAYELIDPAPLKVFGTESTGPRKWKDDGAAGSGSFVPLVTGDEPLVFVSNGAGSPVLVPFTL